MDLSYGATEAKPPLFADGIVDCTETGASLRANRLRILDTVFESTTQFIANRDVYKKDVWKRTKLNSIALLLKSCLTANSNVSMRIQTSRSEAEIIEALIPSDARFSVWNGQHDDLLFEVIIDQGKTRELVPVLARNGAIRISVSSMDMLYG